MRTGSRHGGGALGVGSSHVMHSTGIYLRSQGCPGWPRPLGKAVRIVTSVGHLRPDTSLDLRFLAGVGWDSKHVAHYFLWRRGLLPRVLAWERSALPRGTLEICMVPCGRFEPSCLPSACRGGLSREEVSDLHWRALLREGRLGTPMAGTLATRGTPAAPGGWPVSCPSRRIAVLAFHTCVPGVGYSMTPSESGALLGASVRAGGVV